MARVKIDQIVQKVADNTAATAAVTVRLRGTTTAAQLYNAAGGSIANPISTVSGCIEAYVDEGRYDLVISGAGFSTYTQEFEAVAPLTAGSVSNTLLADNAITNIKINDAAVTTSKVDDNAITTPKIANDTITTAKIAPSSVTTAKLSDGAITSDKIAASAVDNTKLGAGVIRLSHLHAEIISSGTAFPGSPVDGQQFDLIQDETIGVVWRFRYRAASASAYKWEFVGGPPLGTFTTADALTLYGANTAWFLVPGGPSYTIKRAGDYHIQINGGGSVGSGSFMNGVSVAGAYQTTSGTASNARSSAATHNVPSNNSVVAFAAANLSTTSTGSMGWRSMYITPIRCS